MNDGGLGILIFDKLPCALVDGSEVLRHLYATKHVQQQKLIDGRREGMGVGGGRPGGEAWGGKAAACSRRTDRQALEGRCGVPWSKVTGSWLQAAAAASAATWFRLCSFRWLL